MSQGEILSLIINLGVGLYLALYYRRTVQRSFRGNPVPPLFRFLSRVLPPLGILLIGASLLYAALRVSHAL